MTDITQQTKMLAESHALDFKDHGNGHVQISGHGMLVNYWPESKNRTAQISGGETVKHCSPFDAVKLCMAQDRVVLKPGKKPSVNGPDFDLKPITTNPAGIKHFYDGSRPPWDFDGLVLCEPDRLRIQASRLLDEAMIMEANNE